MRRAFAKLARDRPGLVGKPATAVRQADIQGRVDAMEARGRGAPRTAAALRREIGAPYSALKRTLGAARAFVWYQPDRAPPQARRLVRWAVRTDKIARRFGDSNVGG